MKKTLIFLSLCLLLGSFAVCDPSSIKIGSQVPELKLPTLSGSSYDLSSDRGKPVIITFYSTWSHSCLEQLEFLNSLSSSNKDLKVVAVALEKNSSPVKSFLDKNGFSFTSLIDKKMRSLDPFQVLIIPTAFLIDDTGILRNIYVDFDETVKNSMASDIKSLLSSKK
ncbi:MAG: TlpA disulfide reductase family protein [Candidatus Margulisiibacteriota bacterium]